MNPKARFPLVVFVPELFVAKGNLAAYFQKLRAAGVHRVRAFWLQSWSAIRLVPWVQAVYNGKLVRLNKPKDGVRDCPVTNMAALNPAFWQRAALINSLLKANDLGMDVTLGDNCSQRPRQFKLSYPMNASLQTMSKQDVWPYLDPPEARKICTASSGGLYGKAKWGYYKDWIANVVRFMNESGVDFRIEIQNEFSRLDWDPAAKQPAEWYAMMVKAVQDIGVPNNRILHSGDQSIVLKHPGIFSMHRIAQAGLYPTTANFSKLMISSDGSYNGKYRGRSLTDVDILGGRGVSVSDGIAMAKMTRDQGVLGGIEIMQKRLWKDSDYLANVDYALFDVLAAITAEWAK